MSDIHLSFNPYVTCGQFPLDMRASFLALMPNIGLTLAIGQYAQDAYLGDARHKTGGTT